MESLGVLLAILIGLAVLVGIAFFGFVVWFIIKTFLSVERSRKNFNRTWNGRR